MRETAKPYKGISMEGRIARWYTKTRANDLEDFRRRAEAVAKKLCPGADVLEVAPGPGFFSIELAKAGDFHISGLDISRGFVQIASEKARTAGVDVDFRLGNASAMPFADESFDLVYCSAAFKNFSEPVQAINEMYRVLRPGGQAIIEDLRKDVSVGQLNAYIRQSGRSRFDAWLTKWTFRLMLIKRAYTQDQFNQMASQSRFHGCELALDAIGFEARFTKPRPAMAAA